jgi:hypothetical protein
MTIHIAIAIFFTSFVYVLFKSLQQKAVVADQRKWIVPISFCLASCEVFSMLTIVMVKSWWLILPIGLGAGIGCLTGMEIFNRYLKVKT